MKSFEEIPLRKEILTAISEIGFFVPTSILNINIINIINILIIFYKQIINLCSINLCSINLCSINLCSINYIFNLFLSAST